MLDKESIKKVDVKKMYKAYDSWPEIAEKSYNDKKIISDLGKFENIVFSGMGGSGAISDIFSAILSRKAIHTDIVKGYHLPKTVNHKSLVVITSVSGNTVETINILQQAIKAKAKIISFSSGGELEKISRERKIEHIKIDMINSPRASLTKYLYVMLKNFEDVLPIKESEIQTSIQELKNTGERISSKNLTSTNDALDLAKWIDKTPIIYYPWGLQSAAIRFKNSLQENSKMHVITEDVLETSHNGIVPWEVQKNFCPILIRGDNDFIKTSERWEIIKYFFEINEIEFKEIFSTESGILSKIVNLIYFLDYVSIYKAILLGIDPTPVNSIDFIKKQIKN